MQLATPRLLIDALRPTDAPALFACRGDPLVARFQGWQPVDIEAVDAFIAAQMAHGAEPPQGWFQRAIRLRDSGELIGDLGINLPAEADASVEFGISIAPARQGRGYATETLQALFAQLFQPWRRHRVHASVDPRNLPSMAMLRALGMRQEAHHRESLWFHGEWADDVIFALLAREWIAAHPRAD
jgi:RimJ/RimL family protein N-acetyltransferase